MQLVMKALRAVLYNPSRHAKKLPFVSIGDGTVILPSTRFVFRLGEDRFCGRIKIGANSMIGGELIFESESGDITIGDNTFINGGTRIICRDHITIGSNVTIAWGCTLYDHNSHSLAWQERAADIRQQIADVNTGRNFIASKDWTTVKSRPIVIEDKAWLGFGVTVLNGVTIGEGAIIGACSVVRENVPAWNMAFGNPAASVKTVRK